MAWILRTYRICNSTVEFSKYEFYNKLLGGVTLFRVIPGVTWTQPIYIFSFLDNYRVTLPSPPKRKKRKIKEQ